MAKLLYWLELNCTSEMKLIVSVFMNNSGLFLT